MGFRSNDITTRVLVTGLKGFTGVHVGRALRARGFRVYGLDCDIRDSEAVGQRVKSILPDVVIHLAGIANVAHGDAAEMYKVNLIGSSHLFASIAELKKPPRNTIVASSASIYGDAPESPITEDNLPDPKSDYGVSKTAVEYLVRVWRENFPWTVVRPFNYTGPGQSTDFVIPKIVEHFRAKAAVIELGNLDVIREYNDIRRTVEAYCRLVDIDGIGETYNIASEKGTALRDVLVRCSRLSGHIVDVRVNPRYVRRNEVAALVGSKRKLEATIGPLPDFSLEETLEGMLSERRGTRSHS